MGCTAGKHRMLERIVDELPGKVEETPQGGTGEGQETQALNKGGCKGVETWKE